MNPRDFLTSAAIGLVLIVGGLAIADSVRGCDSTNNEAAPTQTTAPTTTGGDGPAPQEDAPEGWPEGELDGVLTFVDADSCLVRAIGLSGGRERPLAVYRTNCGGFWAPRVGARISYEVDSATRNRFLFQISDTGQGLRDYGNYISTTDLVWSLDGQRIAWCDSPRSGIEREILGGARILPFCPIAYTPEGNLAHAEGRRLVVGRRTLLTASGQIDFAQFAAVGSIGVLVDGNTLERYVNGKEAASADVPAPFIGAPAFSPDTCMVAAPVDAGIRVIPLGCNRIEVEGRHVDVSRSELVEFGHAASWSPSGEWLAVAEPRRITFHRMVGRTGFSLVWPADTFQLQWRSD